MSPRGKMVALIGDFLNSLPRRPNASEKEPVLQSGKSAYEPGVIKATNHILGRGTIYDSE